MEALLALEDGRVFPGRAFGAVAERSGEVVFNTSMTGYQEILSDPSYGGQIVVMTAPEIGNVGTNALDLESRAPQVEGFAVRELSGTASSWRSTQALHEHLKEHGIPGIAEIMPFLTPPERRCRVISRESISAIPGIPCSLRCS